MPRPLQRTILQPLYPPANLFQVDHWSGGQARKDGVYKARSRMWQFRITPYSRDLFCSRVILGLIDNAVASIGPGARDTSHLWMNEWQQILKPNPNAYIVHPSDPGPQGYLDWEAGWSRGLSRTLFVAGSLHFSMNTPSVFNAWKSVIHDYVRFLLSTFHF